MTEYSFIENDDEICHYGMPRRSGRYPWGSGKDPYQHAKDFLTRIDQLRAAGWQETPDNIREQFGLSVKEYKWEKSLCIHDRRSEQVNQVENMKKDGMTTTQIANALGKNESSIRSLLESKSKARMKELDSTISFLKDRMNEYDMLDIGKGTERELRVSRDKLDAAAYYLTTREGYHVYSGGVSQVTNPSQQTIQMVLAKPGIPWKDIYKYDKIGSMLDYSSSDDGKTFQKFHYPESMDSKRLKIRYAEEGGLERDGLVELRPGVADLSLSGAKYSQVRMLVDNTHYIKGMAVYGDPKDFPPGVDVIFNTNKRVGKPMKDVLKEIKKEDPENPFGSAIKPNGQYWYDDPTTGKKKLGLVNKRADEGDWSEWSDTVPSQFLSKQPLQLASKQLGLAKENKLKEYDELMSLTNPTLKKHLLEKFASQCDSDAVSLKAAAFPGQKYHVIIPINSLKDNEVYAPNYEDGTKLALVRYPHGGIFEIPILTVNNKNKDGRKFLGSDAYDAVGITSKVANQLSGADFDGDAVMAIPTGHGGVNIRNKPPLKELENFDTKLDYPHVPGAKIITKSDMYKKMGEVSNLITDMTLAGASDSEIARATKHSMVMIDAYKHKLNYKQSEIDNNIDELKRIYQIKVDADGNPTGGYGGASTIISRAKSEERVPKRKGEGNINIKGKPWYDPTKPEGALVFKTAPESERIYQKAKVLKNGTVKIKTEERTTKSTKMAEASDARSLMSAYKWPMEEIYADYANSMKSLANKARLSLVNTPRIAINPKAKTEYAAEIESLMDKLNTAELNAPRERAALRAANTAIRDIEATSGKLDKEDRKKAAQRAISSARTDVGSVSRRDRNINITDREWEAIQSGAISESKLTRIFANADIDSLRERATPRAQQALTDAKQRKIQALQDSGKTIAQIADALNVSTSTVSKYLQKG